MAAAAASIALHCGGRRVFLRSEDATMGSDHTAQRHFYLPTMQARPRSVAMRRWSARSALASVSQQRVVNDAASNSVYVGPLGPRSVFGGAGRSPRGGSTCREAASQETLDEWMRESVSEIVRNIGQAPFLVHVFSNGDEVPSAVRLEREAADAGSWPLIKKRWSTGGALPPDGVILVEELKGEEVATKTSDDVVASCARDDKTASSKSPSSKTWGVLVQGQITDGAAACYILNTCRVRSSSGFCTHFCLARAKCFGDTADVQLRNAWLLGRRNQFQRQ